MHAFSKNMPSPHSTLRGAPGGFAPGRKIWHKALHRSLTKCRLQVKDMPVCESIDKERPSLTFVHNPNPPLKEH
jgi:hypothetical protein